MRAVIVGDVHFRAKKLKDIAEAWSRAVKWGRKNQVDMILQAGDVFDRPNIFGREADVGTICSAFLDPFSDKNPAQEYAALLAPFEKPFCRLFLIPGNHDQGGPRDADALAAFDSHPWITVAHRPNLVPVSDDFAVCAVPWVNRAQLMAKLVDKGISAKEARERVSVGLADLMEKLRKAVRVHQEDGKFVLLLGHLEVTGADCGNGTKQTGGSFEFSPKQVADVGADAYALAHIHMRQHLAGLPNPNDGYLGTLCQLSYGEQGRETGFRFLETEGRKIKEDRMINNSVSPRYFLFSSKEELDKGGHDPEKDYVRLRGKEKPEDLPDNVEFECLPEKAVSQRRIDKILTADSPLAELLEAWIQDSGCDVPLKDLVEAAKKIETQTLLPAEAVGSLDRLNRVLLQNVASHEHTEIDLSGLSGICGIEGQTGSGKTTFLEALIVAFYGHCPSRPSLPALVRNRSGVKDALFEVDVVSGGKEVSARREFRKTRKTFSHSAYLFETKKGPQDAIAGPKVDNVNNASSLLIGDLGMVLAGVFSAQDEMNNIVNLDPAPRKELFAKTIGTDKYLAMGKTVEKEVKGDNAALEVMFQQAQDIKAKLTGEQAAVQRLGVLKTAVEEGKEAVAIFEERLRKLESKQEKVVAARKEAEKAVEAIANLEKKKASIKEEGKKLVEQKKMFAQTDMAAMKKDLSDLKAKSDLLGKKHKELSKAEKSASELREKASEIRSKAASMLAERKQAFAEFRMEASQKQAAIETERAKKRAAIVSKLEAINIDAVSLQSKLEEAERQKESLKGFPDADICSKCPLAKDGMKARDNVPELRRAVKRARERINKGHLFLDQHDKETKEMTEQASHVASEGEWQLDVVAKAEKTEAKAKALAEEALAAMPSDDLRQECEGLAKEIARIPEVEAAIEKAQSSHLEVAKIDERIKALKEMYEIINKQLSEISVPEVPQEDYIPEISRARSEKDDAQQELAIATKDLGRIEATLDAFQQDRKTLAETEKKIQEKAARLAAYNALAKAFGRDGIAQLIVDSTIPHLQDIMSDLMRELDGTFTIQIRTQKETKGAYKEVIDILVDDGFGERDIKTYSGGEKQLLKMVIRIAFATLQSERSGKGLKVLILDEATDAMDPALADTFIRMLSRLSGSFNQIFVVSHNDYVLSSLSNRIIFSVQGDRTRAILANS